MAVAIVILIGPLMIPWLLFEPLAFLFWGWFRALLVYSLYGVVAAVILRVFVSVSLTFLSTLMSAGFNVSDLQQLGLWFLLLAPLLVAGILAAFKVGEIASLLVSGAGSAGAGLMSTIALGAGAGKAAGALKGGK